ncbi:activating signal cointegrator 1 complex subunit 2 homolog isoform X2 [Drosophila santomea]|uniref:activating signal cointegrator 1 complex subunit 2 homolog isoform X2 n=1 Tax=Drosophila santomea TaxID=129105 RepID=UPI001953177A|nr:activating signal cointegrator 1 complex subunit 2 homolog isoform X2 [Drosophila santomea]
MYPCYKTFVLTLALCACLAAADVSHLQPSTSYLPPPRPEHAVSMSIEQQELRELPEQVEYMRPNEQGQMEPMPSSLLTPPAPVDQQEAMPSSRYLPPAPAPVPVPVEMTVEPVMMPQMEVMEKVQQQPELAHRYLPPAPVSEQQLTYQQYQEQMQQIQMHDEPQEQQPQQPQEQPEQEDQQATYVLDVQQPMAPSDVETQEPLEPEPAHELRSDGYYYKQAEEQRRLRH